MQNEDEWFPTHCHLPLDASEVQKIPAEEIFGWLITTRHAGHDAKAFVSGDLIACFLQDGGQRFEQVSDVTLFFDKPFGAEGRALVNVSGVGGG